MKCIKGFTLIELVVVIVILGMTVITVTSFIGQGTLFYVESISRNSEAYLAENIILRLQKEINNTIPFQISIENCFSECHGKSGKLSMVPYKYVFVIKGKEVYEINRDNSSFIEKLTDSDVKFFLTLGSHTESSNTDIVSDLQNIDNYELLVVTNNGEIKSNVVSEASYDATTNSFAIKFINSIDDSFYSANKIYLHKKNEKHSFWVNKNYEMVYKSSSSASALSVPMNINSQDDVASNIKIRAFVLNGALSNGNGNKNSEHINSVVMDLVIVSEEQPFSVTHRFEVPNYDM